MAKKIVFPKQAAIRRGPPHKGGNLYLDATAKCIVTSRGLGVYQGIKCVEYFKKNGDPVPKGTPTFAECEAEWKRQQKEKARA